MQVTIINTQTLPKLTQRVSGGDRELPHQSDHFILLLQHVPSRQPLSPLHCRDALAGLDQLFGGCSSL